MFWGVSMRRSKKGVALEVITDILLICLAGDLLYLYWRGTWYDPLPLVEVLEVLILVGAVALGIFRLGILLSSRK